MKFEIEVPADAPIALQHAAHMIGRILGSALWQVQASTGPITEAQVTIQVGSTLIRMKLAK